MSVLTLITRLDHDSNVWINQCGPFHLKLQKERVVGSSNLLLSVGIAVQDKSGGSCARRFEYWMI
jgi:hypothetical protein